MPYSRPGKVQEVPATKACTHGDPVEELGMVGVASKQKVPSIGTALADVKDIAIGETFALIMKGEVEIPAVTGVSRGELVYIKQSDNTLGDAAGSGIVPLGRCVKVATNQGTPTGKIRVNLDDKG